MNARGLVDRDLSLILFHDTNLTKSRYIFKYSPRHSNTPYQVKDLKLEERISERLVVITIIPLGEGPRLARPLTRQRASDARCRTKGLRPNVSSRKRPRIHGARLRQGLWCWR